MIIFDTNVVSELMRETPNVSVTKWVASRQSFHYAVTTITIAEINRGLSRLPSGKRRQKLEQNFENFVQKAFAQRIFSFDQQAAYLYGDVAIKREKAGLHVDSIDMMIVAIAKSVNATIATRNIKDFNNCGVKLINPWSP